MLETATALDAVSTEAQGLRADLQTLQGDARLPDFFYPIWQSKDAHIQWLPKAFIDKVGLGLPLFVVVSGDGQMRYWHASALNPKAHRELVTAAVAPFSGD